MMYNIYHPFGGIMNHNCERGLYEYQQVATVEANSLEEAYRLAQNENDSYTKNDVRSTSVGDIITSETGHYMVKNIGFYKIPHTVTSFIDWGNHMSNVELIAQQALENPEDYGLI